MEEEGSIGMSPGTVAVSPEKGRRCCTIEGGYGGCVKGGVTRIFGARYQGVVEQAS